MKVSFFLKIFILFLLLTFIFHPKPICSTTHRRGCGCFSFAPSWITMRNKFESTTTKVNIYPGIKELTFRERFINQEVGFDVFVAVAISLTASLLYMLLLKLKIRKLFLVLIIFVTWLIVNYSFSLPYRHCSFSKFDSPIFKPLFGGIE